MWKKKTTIARKRREAKAKASKEQRPSSRVVANRALYRAMHRFSLCRRRDCWQRSFDQCSLRRHALSCLKRVACCLHFCFDHALPWTIMTERSVDDHQGNRCDCGRSYRCRWWWGSRAVASFRCCPLSERDGAMCDKDNRERDHRKWVKYRNKQKGGKKTRKKQEKIKKKDKFQ